ncbi:unnamed protein product [Aphanomyces euteiches]
MSKRVPLLKPTLARKPTRGIAPKVKPSSQTSNSASQPKASSTSNDEPSDVKSKEATQVASEPPRMESKRDEDAKGRPETKKGEPTEHPREPEAPPVKVAPQVQTPRLRGIVTPGSTFGITPPRQQTLQRQSPRGIRIPDTSSTGPAKSTKSTNIVRSVEKSGLLDNEAQSPRAVPVIDMPTQEKPTTKPKPTKPKPTKTKTTKPKTKVAPRASKRTMPSRKKSTRSATATALQFKPIKDKFIEYAQSQPSTTPSTKRKRKAKDDEEEDIPYETEADIAGMTMGQLALTVPRGRRIDEDDGDEDGEDDGQDNQEPPPSKRTRRENVPPRNLSAGMPQVEFVDGQIVVAEHSLTVHEDELMGDEDAEPEDERLGRGGYLTGRRSSKRWSHLETKQFFYGLSQVGTDFTLMETMFPNRSRGELKLKFKSEEKKHRALVDMALMAANRPLGKVLHRLYRLMLCVE